MKATPLNTLLRGKNIALTTVALAAMVTSASAASISNGSFENLTKPGVSAELGTAGGQGQDVTGWNDGGAGYNFVYVPGMPVAMGQDGLVALWGPPGVSPDGGNYVALDSDFGQGAFSTDVTGLTVGQTVSVSFYWATGQQVPFTGAATTDLQVTLGSQEITTNSITNPGHVATPWVLDTLTFTATATTESLSFLADGSPGGVPSFALLDGVTVSSPAAPSPEPSSLILLGTGLAGIAGVLRRKLSR
jgi:hypothetical protein